MGLFSSSKIEGSELQECLAYFEAETRVIAFQTKEADLFNNAMVKYGNSVMQNPLAAEDMKKAANRLSQAAAEILKRHEKIKNVPIAASAMRSAWHETFLANATWASAMVTAIESNIFAFLSAAQGMNPQIKRAQQCAEELQKAWQRADTEDRKFLKRLKVSSEDTAEILSRATTSLIHEDWEPRLPDVQDDAISGVSIDEREGNLKDENKIQEMKGKMLLAGIASSPGITMGIIRNIGEKDSWDTGVLLELTNEIRQGEIIVAKPPYGRIEPELLKKVSAVVIDNGSRTCSVAIVARELGIPAITGTLEGTKLLKTGQRVIVDGNEGIICATIN
jgi:phosphohistidine swiveling domain-containing protein